MACASPPELEDEQILKYLDGEADPRVAAHVAQCAHCRERVKRLARLQEQLTAQLYRTQCPTSQELGEYHLGTLPGERAVLIAQHVAECPHCAEELAQLKEYLGAVASDLEVGPVERARVWVAELIRGGTGMAGQGRLTSAPAYAGVRGEGEGPRIYQAGEVQVAIDVQEDMEQPGLHALLGLVTGIQGEGWAVHLWRENQDVAQTAVDDLGNFVIRGLAAGQYELILSGLNAEIHIHNMNVGTRTNGT